VKSVIVHADGRRINLAGGLAPELYEELEGTIGHSPRANPTLHCGGCGDGIYVKHGSTRKDELFGAHYDVGNCPETLRITGAQMSDEHKRQQEYHVRAARAQGLDADAEVTTTGRTRVDVVVRDGPGTAVGIEVQRSHVSITEARGRTARSVASGLKLVAWASDAPDSSNPLWIGRVPWYRIPDQREFWQAVPDIRSIRAYGILDIDAERSYRGWQPMARLLRPLVDFVIASLVDGSVKPVLPDGKNVRLVTASGIARWQEITGRVMPAWNPDRPPPRTVAPAVEAACDRPMRIASYCGVPDCEEPARLYACGWRCDNHQPARRKP